MNQSQINVINYFTIQYLASRFDMNYSFIYVISISLSDRKYGINTNHNIE